MAEPPTESICTTRLLRFARSIFHVTTAQHRPVLKKIQDGSDNKAVSLTLAAGK